LLEDNLIEKNKISESFNFKNSEIFSSLEEINNPDKKITDFIQEFILQSKINMSKRRYIKVLNDIHSNEKILYESSERKKILEIKLRAILKILNERIVKNEAQNNNQANSIKTKSLFEEMEKDMTDWISNIKEITSHEVSESEVFIEIYLNYLYISSLNYKANKQYNECASLPCLSYIMI